MKFTCERDELVATLSTANRGVVNRPEKPILSCLLLEVNSGKLTATATDQHLWIQSSMDVAKGAEDGSVAIPARYLVEALRSLDAGSVTFESEDNKTRVESGKAKFVFNHLSADNYPQMTTDEFAETSVSSEEFLGAVGQVVIARSTDEARTVLTSALIVPEEEGNLRMVCTDSYRLALRDLEKIKLTIDNGDKDILVPGRALEEVNRLAGKVKEITIGISERHISFAADNSFFMTQLIDGDYPKYKNLIPEPDAYPNTLHIAASDDETGQARLNKAINQVKIMTNPDTPVKLMLEKSKITLHTSTDHGESTTELEASYNGEDMTVAFNPKYLQDGVDACPGDELFMYLLDELKPAVLRGNPQEDFLYLLMPVRVSS